MDNSSLHRGMRATALAFLTLTALLVGSGCGKGGGGGPTDPGPSDPGPSDPEPSSWPGPDPVGYVMFAVDLSNNFLVFGSESMEVLTAKMRITGLPILKRIIGIAYRPSNGKLYGVGNDSQVYTIDPLSAEATPVGSGPFSPKIASFFDIHFAMDLEPKTERVRLIAAESGGNWSISLDDGTAILEENSRYAAGTPLEGQTPRLLGLAFAPPADTADASLCQNLAYAIDADEAIMLAACDPATGEWWPTGSGQPPQASLTHWSTGERPQPASASAPKAFEELKDQLLRCGEFMFEPGGPIGPSGSGEPRPQEGGPWFPRTPATPAYAFLVELGHASNRVGVVKPFDTDPFMLGVTERWTVPSDEPIQTVEWVPHKSPLPPKLRHQVRQEFQLSVAPPSDPRAQCGNAS